MAHELVFRSDGQARMIFAQTDGAALPWHGYGQGKDKWTVMEAADAVLDGSGAVTVESLYTGSGKLAQGVAATLWEGEQIGLVGPNYRPIQNGEFFRSFLPWEEQGLATVETAGLLRGGQIAWMQLRLSGDPIEIRKGDHVRPYYFGSNGHDKSVGVNGGLVVTRIVCNNTRRMALRELKDNGSDTLRFKHTGNVGAKLANLQAVAIGLRQAALKEAEELRYLAQVKVASEETARRFVLGLQGKRDYMSLVLDEKISRVEEDVIARFTSGIGNRGESFWDLVCASDERLDHDLGNVKVGESEADRIGRRLDNAWFGPGANARGKALDVALAMASAVQPRNSVNVLV